MKLVNYKIFAIFAILAFVSCENEAKDLKEHYKNQEHSEALKGWWRHLDQEENKNPLYEHFTDFELIIYDYSIYTNKYDHNRGRYWYNDASKIYFLTPGDFKSKGDEDSYSYILNSTKDTLKIYMENPPYIFVKSAGL